MSSRIAWFIALLAGALLAGCATTPYDIGKAETGVTPQQAVNDLPRMLERHVAWGGKIAVAKNLKDRTEIEVVAYPLDTSNRPDEDAQPIGRFIVVHPGYLETADYAPGRLVTVVGKVNEVRQGKVGEAQYAYPVIKADALHLWPKPDAARNEPRIHFGVGVGIIR